MSHVLAAESKIMQDACGSAWNLTNDVALWGARVAMFGWILAVAAVVWSVYSIDATRAVGLRAFPRFVATGRVPDGIAQRHLRGLRVYRLLLLACILVMGAAVAMIAVPFFVAKASC